MDYLENFIKKFNKLTCREQCKCIENKLLSFNYMKYNLLYFLKSYMYYLTNYQVT